MYQDRPQRAPAGKTRTPHRHIEQRHVIETMNNHDAASSKRKKIMLLPASGGRFGLITGETSAFAKSTTSIKITWVLEQKE
jgi:hypothetical protein